MFSMVSNSLDRVYIWLIYARLHTEYGLDIESDGLGTRKAWKPFRGLYTCSASVAYRALRSRSYDPTVLLSAYAVVRNVEEAADRPYAYIICASKCIPEVTSTPALLAPLLSTLENLGPHANFTVQEHSVLSIKGTYYGA